RVTTAQGMTPLDSETNPGSKRRFYSKGEGKLEIFASLRGTMFADAELAGAQLTGVPDATAHCVNFQLKGEARCRTANTRLRLLSGCVALGEGIAGDGWHVEIAPDAARASYDLVLEKSGSFSIDLKFAAALTEKEGWNTLDFQMPAGIIVPISLEG